ncbi:MAG: N-acetyltransferase [Bacteroidetes bacterium]|nr:MAG: N-acetyltransferase [Bacteroidota bacterium]
MTDFKQLIDKNFNLHATFIPEMHPQMKVFREAGFSFVDSGILSDSFNILHIYKASDLVPEKLKSAIEYFKNLNLPFCIWANEEEANPSIRNILEKRSVTEVNKEPGMVLDLLQFTYDSHEKIELEIVRASSREHMLHFASTIAANMRPPDKNVIDFFTKTSAEFLKSDISIFVLYKNQLPIAVLEAFPTDKETIGIYNFTTLKEFRKKGFGRFLLSHALFEAKQSGYKYVILQASEDGIGLYEQIGFRRIINYYEFQ